MTLKLSGLALAAMAAMTAITAHAVTTGTLRFEGLIRGGTCNLAAGDVDRTINLDPVLVTDFDEQVSAGKKDFQLTANCDLDVSSVTFTFSGTPSPADRWRFANTGTAQGIALLLASGGKTIRADGTDSARTITASNGVALMPLDASYWKVGRVSSGTLVSQVIVQITYN